MHQNENWGVCDIKYVVVWVLLKLCPKPFYKSLTVSYLYTGCPINWYPLSISIPDFPDGPMKKS